MLSNKTKVVGTIALITCVLSVAVLCVLYYAILQKEAAYYEQVAQRALGRATDRQLASLVNLVGDTQAERTELISYVLPSDGVISFLALIEDLGAEQGLVTETKSITVEPLSKKDFESLTLTLEVRGTYERVQHMLDLIETLPYQIDINTVSIRAEGNVWVGSFDLQVTKFSES